MDENLNLSRGFLNSALEKLKLAEYSISMGSIRNAAENLVVANEMILKALYFSTIHNFLSALHSVANEAIYKKRCGLWNPSIEINIQKVEDFIKKFKDDVKNSPKRLGHKVHSYFERFSKKAIRAIYDGSLRESLLVTAVYSFSQIKEKISKFSDEKLGKFVETLEDVSLDLITKIFSIYCSVNLRELQKFHLSEKEKCCIKYFEEANQIICIIDEILKQIIAKCLDEVSLIGLRYNFKKLLSFRELGLNIDALVEEIFQDKHGLAIYLKRIIKCFMPIHLLLVHSYIYPCTKASYPDVTVEACDNWENILKSFASALKTEIDNLQWIIEKEDQGSLIAEKYET